MVASITTWNHCAAMFVSTIMSSPDFHDMRSLLSIVWYSRLTMAVLMSMSVTLPTSDGTSSGIPISHHWVHTHLPRRVLEPSALRDASLVFLMSSSSVASVNCPLVVCVVVVLHTTRTVTTTHWLRFHYRNWYWCMSNSVVGLASFTLSLTHRASSSTLVDDISMQWHHALFSFSVLLFLMLLLMMKK